MPESPPIGAVSKRAYRVHLRHYYNMIPQNRAFVNFFYFFRPRRMPLRLQHFPRKGICMPQPRGIIEPIRITEIEHLQTDDADDAGCQD